MPDISIGRLRGGFCVYWDDPETGKRRRYQLAARTRAQAEAEGRDRYLKETATPGGMTVAEIWEAYRIHLGSKKTAETMSYTGKAILPAFGALRPDQITVEDCRTYLRDRLAAGRKIGSAHTELGHLRSALRWAAKVRVIDRAPYIELPPKPDSNVRPLTDAQIRALLDGCGSPHVRLAVILLLTTGARVGAVLDLEWSRIDFDRGVIDLRLPDGVTRKGRAVVPMNRMARAALESAYPARLTDHVVEWAGKRIKSIRTGYAAALERAGLGEIHIHQIRHTVAVRMLTAGRPIEEVSQYLGHSNIAITHKTYARFMPEHLAGAAEVLEFIEPARTSQNQRK
ncbi:integrase [Mameliella alba]|nr:tyrosine-type recombinase/integrase [Mameliella alba]OWV64275.1 integrase [Mameliella alba]